MSEEKVICPFCGTMVEKNAYRCPECKSLFSEPELPFVKFQDFRIFFVLMILTGGLFSILWFIINTNAFNKLVINNPKDNIKLNWLIALLLIVMTAFYFGFIKFSAAAITIIIMIMLTYRMLRIIQKYSKQTYDVIPEINPYYVGIFNIFYLLHFIDTYKERVLEEHEHFDPKSPQMIALIIILIIIQGVSILNPHVCEYYLWLLKPSGIG